MARVELDINDGSNNLRDATGSDLGGLGRLSRLLGNGGSKSSPGKGEWQRHEKVVAEGGETSISGDEKVLVGVLSLRIKET